MKLALRVPKKDGINKKRYDVPYTSFASFLDFQADYVPLLLPQESVFSPFLHTLAANTSLNMAKNVLLGLISAIGAAAQTNWTIGQTVQTSSGSVQGHAAPLKANVSEYLGIPFAQPPVGTLRFAPPTPINSTSQIINGTNFGFSCLGAQIYPVGANASGLTQQGREIYNEWNQVGDKFAEDCTFSLPWHREVPASLLKTYPQSF